MYNKSVSLDKTQKLWYNISVLKKGTVDCPTEAAGHGVCGVATGARQQKNTGKQSVPFYGEAVYCVQHELHKRVARTLCSFAVATYTRCVEAERMAFREYWPAVVATYKWYVEAKKGKFARIELCNQSQPTRGAKM